MQFEDVKDIIFLAVEDYFQDRNLKAAPDFVVDKNQDNLHLLYVNTYYKGTNIFDEVFIKDVNKNYPLLQVIDNPMFILIKPLIGTSLFQKVRYSAASVKRLKSFLRQSKIKFLNVGSYILILKTDDIPENIRFDFNYMRYAKKGFSIRANYYDKDFDIGLKRAFLVKLPHVEINKVFVASKQTYRYFISEEDNKIHTQNNSYTKYINNEISKFIYTTDIDLEFIPMLASLGTTSRVHIDDVPRLYGEKMIKVLVDK